MPVYVGVDVAKATLACWVRPLNESFSVSNDPEGWLVLINRLKSLPVARVLLEATGGYEKSVLEALIAAGIPALRVMPNRVRAFAVAMGRLAKTDPIDAAVLAHFAEVAEIPGEPEFSPEREELRVLVQRRDQLVQMRDDERRRQLQAKSAFIRDNILRHVSRLDDEIKKLDEAIDNALEKLDAVEAKLLLDVPGIGRVTTATLLSRLPELGKLTGKQVSALAGLAPWNSDSGTRSGKRAIAGGRADVRRVLYMATWSVIRTQPAFKTRYTALRARGKLPKVALVACMRVLLVRLNAMLRDGIPWKMGD